MEVHAHSHTARKKWTHYLWEFLMLFLAVFCGFLAEYKLEQTIERHREKEFMSSLYQDLKTDTVNLGALLRNKADEIATYDSAFAIFRNKTYLKETSGAYYFGRKLLTFRPFIPTDGTINQLESSGGLRLIRSRPVVDSIQSYKAAVAYLKFIQDFEREHFLTARGLMGKIYDADVFDRMLENLGSDGNVMRPDQNYPLRPFTPEQLNDFHVPMNFIRRNKTTQAVYMNRLLKKATDLMKLVREKYKIKEE